MNEMLKQWNKVNNERVKLQYAYAALALITLVVAGLSSLVNSELGDTILTFAFGLTLVFLVNAISWVLLDAFVLKRIPKSSTSKRKS